MQNSKRAGIQKFLQNRRNDSPFLIDRWKPSLETQYMVFPGSAEDGTSDDSQKVWTDGTETWANHRWPYKASSAPSYRDTPLTFDPSVHLDRVGSTWWDWENKESVAIGFDIDAEDSGHAEGTNKLSESRMDEIVALLSTIPYVTLVRSTGGKGVHGYIFFKEDYRPKTMNHSEHTQVALATIDKLCKDTDFNFLDQNIIDVKGVVLWFWASSSPANHPGFSLIKEAETELTEDDIGDWRTSVLNRHYHVIPKVEGYTESGNFVSEEQPAYEIYPLDDTHRDILKELEDIGYVFVWNKDFNMAHTHTCALKALFKKREAEGRPLRGIFDTISKGTDRAKPNCYLSARPDGAFRVARFGNSTTEHPSWQQYNGKTWTFFNQDADVKGLLIQFANEDQLPSSYELTFTKDNLEAAMQLLGESLGDEKDQINTSIRVKLHKGQVLASIKQTGDVEGWNRPKGSEYQHKVLSIVYSEERRQKNLLEEADKIVRFLVTPDNHSYGWCLHTDKGWVMFNGYDPVACVVRNLFGKGEADMMRSVMVQMPWKICHRPFQAEEPGDRLWNKNAPQLAFKPADVSGPCQHFDLIFDHLGRSLNEEVAQTEWCSRWGIQSGADYLRFWVASLIKHPDQPLPYLFFYGPQNSGKSIFFETLAMLFTDGVISASQALTGSFNAELANAVLGYIDEKDLSSVRDGMYAKLKEAITSRKILIHPKGVTPYQQPNTLKFVQCNNSPLALPIEDGDTRITVIEVSPLQNIIPKSILEERLKTEAPNFLHSVLSITLPEPIDRLRIPVLNSSAKTDLERINMTPVETAAAELLHFCSGAMVAVKDFHQSYRVWCQQNSKVPESLISVSRQLKNRSDHYLVGRGKGNQNYIANVTMDPKTNKPSELLVLNEKGRLVVQEA